MENFMGALHIHGYFMEKIPIVVIYKFEELIMYL